MREEEIAMLIIGMWFGAPIGWFMKTALTWRRDAKRLAAETKASAPPAPPPKPAVSPALEARLEQLVDRVNQRLEGIEDRLEFTERLIESRRPAIRAGSGASDGE
jgi:hypothetical protein